MMQKLPDELHRKISFMACKPQPKQLCQDIRHYYTSLRTVMYIYKTDSFEHISISPHIYFISDLWEFTKMLNKYQIWVRCFQANSENICSTFNPNIIWAFMDIKERNEFIRLKKNSILCGNNFPSIRL